MEAAVDTGAALMPRATDRREPQTRTLVSKLVKIMDAVGRIKKHGYNKAQNYKYLREEDVVEAARVAMIAHNVVLIPSVESVTWRTIQGRNGEIPVASLLVRWRFIDGDTGEALEFVTAGEGMDSGDKNVYKAMTGALKYALRQPLLIPTGDDPERDDSAGADVDEPPAWMGSRDNAGPPPVASHAPAKPHAAHAPPPPAPVRATANASPATGKRPDVPITEKQRNLLRVLARKRIEDLGAPGQMIDDLRADLLLAFDIAESNDLRQTRMDDAIAWIARWHPDNAREPGGEG